MACERSVSECYGNNGTGSYDRGEYGLCLEGKSYKKGSGYQVAALPCTGGQYFCDGVYQNTPCPPDVPDVPIIAHPTLNEIQCPSGHYAGWDGDQAHAAVCIPYDVVADPAIPPIDEPAPPPVTAKCQRGAAYDRPLFGFGACDDGYVASSGALIAGFGAQCVCAETPGGEIITQTQEGQDTGLGDLMKQLPMLIMLLVVVQVIGAFRK